MPASDMRVREVVAFSLERGDEAALKRFLINEETLSRYKRVYKRQFGEGAMVLAQLENQFTVDELRVIAKSGKVRPTNAVVKELTFTGEVVKFGVLSDTHIGSIYFKDEVIDAAYREFEKERVEFITHSGDVSEGMSYRSGHVYECSEIGYQSQEAKVREVLSRSPAPMYVISGNHDLWFMTVGNIGANIVKNVCDVTGHTYLGDEEGSLYVNGAELRLWHGRDGSSYAKSYRIQKLIESYAPGDKPKIAMFGHVHKQLYMFERNVHCISAGCVQFQSAYMRQKRLAADVGFWVVSACIEDGFVKWVQCRWYSCQ